MEIDLTKTYIPTARQAEAHACTAKYPCYGGAVGGGKSVWLVEEAIDLSMRYPGNVGLICRWELDSLKKTTIETFKQFCPPELIVSHQKQDRTFTLKGGSRVMYTGLKPSAEVNSLEKLKSLSLGWFGMDEASEVPKPYFDMLKTRLRHKLPDGSFPKFRGMLASNPSDGWLRDIFIDQDLEDHAFIPALPTENPHLPPGYVEELRRDLPPELVEILVKGSWDVIVGDHFVFPYTWVRAAMERELEPSEPVEAGLDVARGGDETVLAIRRGPVARIAHRSRYTNTMQTAGEIAEILDKVKPENINVDSVGVGAGLYDRLRELDYPVSEIIAGASPQNKEKFVNRKAEDYWGLRERMEIGNLDLPDEQELRAQLCGIRYEIQSDRRIKIESKSKAKGSGSPDIAEAIIDAYAEGQQAPRIRILA